MHAKNVCSKCRFEYCYCAYKCVVQCVAVLTYLNRGEMCAIFMVHLLLQPTSNLLVNQLYLLSYGYNNYYILYSLFSCGDKPVLEINLVLFDSVDGVSSFREMVQFLFGRWSRKVKLFKESKKWNLCF